MKDRKVTLCTFEDIEEAEPRWIWRPYIPANCATLLFGAGGVGKSYIALDIAARVSTGAPFPFEPADTPDRPPQTVLLLSAEDHPATVIKPRLLRLGADTSRIYWPSRPFILDRAGMRLLQSLVEDCGATFVIVDPLVHYMGGKIDINRMNEVRELLGEIQQEAMSADRAVLLLHHKRKGSGEFSIGQEMAAGSADMVNAVRSALFAQRYEDGTCVLEHVKSNHGEIGQLLSYRISDEGLEWIGAFDAALLASMRRKQGRALTLLRSLLASGPRPADEVLEAMAQEGLSRSTVYRVKPLVAVSERVAREDGRMVWVWRLREESG